MKPSTKRLAMSVAIVLGISSLACDMFVGRIIDKTVDVAANKVGEKVGAVVGERLVALTPGLLDAYATASFRILFYHGGAYVTGSDYQVGQYTRWEGKGIEQGEFFERVLLRRRDDGSEWWRVQSVAKDDEGKTQRLTMEALLAPISETGSRQIRRMRAQFPGESEPREVPITEENASNWLVTGRKLTPESLDGMTVSESTKVEVPAGSFDAKHVRVDGYNKQSRVDWFMVDAVPGGIVKYTNTVTDSDGKDSQTWSMVLMEHGDGSTESKLGVDLDAAPADGDTPPPPPPAE
jgi:hypothetical protein